MDGGAHARCQTDGAWARGLQTERLRGGASVRRRPLMTQLLRTMSCSPVQAVWLVLSTSFCATALALTKRWFATPSCPAPGTKAL